MKIVAVTSCPTGIAHTYMAAEALEQAAKDAGHDIKVETQGAAGAEAVEPTPTSPAPTRWCSRPTSRSATASGSRASRWSRPRSSGPSTTPPA